MITALYAGILTFILLFLLLRVVYLRWKLKVPLGDGGERVLLRAIRAHGNFVETVPWLLLVLLILDLQGVSPAILHAFGITLVIGRLSHAYGLSLKSGLSPGRGFGMLLTLSLFIIGGVLLLLNGI